MRLLAGALALVVPGVPAAGAATPRKKVASPPASNTIRVVVPRGQPIQIAFANDPGSGYATSLANAISMAVGNHPTVDGFPIEVNTVDVATCGNPPNAVAAAATGAYRITSNLQNVAVLGQVCSHGFAQALRIYQTAGVVVITGSATNTALPAAGPGVFNRTVVDDNDIDSWYAAISQLPGDLVWRQQYTDRFGTTPSDYADLYYDAADVLLADLGGASRLDARSDLVVSRATLAHAVRTTAAYPGVTCTVTIDPATGDRVDDPNAIANCAT
jgi:ABC-type branched-subunit amino acid transport system substrate-binding protein